MLFLLALFGFSFCATGIDVAYATSLKAMQCFNDTGVYSFAIVRCYRSVGSVDPNCVSNINNAWAAGFEHVDAYMFPDPKKGNAKQQIADVVKALSVVKYGTLWLDVEGKQYWLGDTGKNKAFFNDLIAGCSEQYVNAGIYSNYYQWEDIFGAPDLPLWYAHYDGKKTFSDYKSFGGWKSPAMKQYEGDKTECGVDLDRNWYP